LKKEIDSDQEDTTKPSQTLQDVYVLAQAYYSSTPPDYLNCAWYATRAAAFAPAAYKTTIEPLASYCYKKYHGSAGWVCGDADGRADQSGSSGWVHGYACSEAGRPCGSASCEHA
jgi:hypothetical protein